jgi:hypothetical protein
MKAIVKLSERVTLEIDERDEMETLSKAIVLASSKKKCTVCLNTEGLHYTSNKDKEGNIYVNVKCPKCGARSKLGQYKAGGYFWHDFEQYIPLQPSNPDLVQKPIQQDIDEDKPINRGRPDITKEEMPTVKEENVNVNDLPL